MTIPELTVSYLSQNQMVSIFLSIRFGHYFIIITPVLANKTLVKRVIMFNSFPNKPWFLLVCSTSLLKKKKKKLWEKGEIARNEQFLLLQCFLSFWRTFFHFHQILIFCLQTLSVWKSLKFVVWEKVKV